MERKSYRSDLTDNQGLLIEPYLPPEKERGSL
ncbi:transposase [Legionella resiliens]